MSKSCIVADGKYSVKKKSRTEPPMFIDLFGISPYSFSPLVSGGESYTRIYDDMTSQFKDILRTKVNNWTGSK